VSLQFVSVNYFSKGSKGAEKILMKLITGINFINFLQAAFVPIFLPKKIIKPN